MKKPVPDMAELHSLDNHRQCELDDDVRSGVVSRLVKAPAQTKCNLHADRAYSL